MPENKETNNSNKRILPIEEAFLFYCTPIKNRMPTYADVAAHYGVSERAIERWGSIHNWVDRRNKVGQKATEAFFKQREEIIKETDRRQFDELDEIETGIVTAVKMLREMQDAILHDNTLDIDQKIKAMKALKMQSLDLRNLAEAMKTAQNQKRIILGMPIDITKADITQTNKNESLAPEEIAEMDAFMEQNNAEHPKTD